MRYICLPRMSSIQASATRHVQIYRNEYSLTHQISLPNMNPDTTGKRSNGSELSKKDVQSLKDSIKGHVVVKGEATEEEYKASVLRWNQVYIKQAVRSSSLIQFERLIRLHAQNYVVYVADEADITTCIQFAAKHDIDVAVAGGRHSYHGASSSDGLVIGERSELSDRCQLANQIDADREPSSRSAEDEKSDGRQVVKDCDSSRWVHRCRCGTAGGGGGFVCCLWRCQ